MSDDDNVIAFPQLRELAETGGPVSRVRRQYSECHHDQGVLVDDVDRVVTCKRCKKPVDAFDALERLAAAWDWEHTRAARDRARAEAEALLAQVDKLKAERVRERRKGYVRADVVHKAFTQLAKRLRQYEGPGYRVAASDVEQTLRNLLDEGGDPG